MILKKKKTLRKIIQCRKCCLIVQFHVQKNYIDELQWRCKIRRIPSQKKNPNIFYVINFERALQWQSNYTKKAAWFNAKTWWHAQLNENESKLNALAHLPAKKPAMANESNDKTFVGRYIVWYTRPVWFFLLFVKWFPLPFAFHLILMMVVKRLKKPQLLHKLFHIR